MSDPGYREEGRETVKVRMKRQSKSAQKRARLKVWKRIAIWSGVFFGTVALGFLMIVYFSGQQPTIH